MRTFIASLMLAVTMLSGCTVHVIKPNVTGPDFTVYKPQKSCKSETSTSSHGRNSFGSNSSTETEVCRWIDDKGRTCKSETTWTTKWVTQRDRKTGKTETTPRRTQSNDSNCR